MIVQQIAGVEIVAAIGNQVISGDDGATLSAVRRSLMLITGMSGLIASMRAAALGDLGPADRGVVVDHLALQIWRSTMSSSITPMRCHPRRRQIEQQRRAETAGADHQDAGPKQPQLTSRRPRPG